MATPTRRIALGLAGYATAVLLAQEHGERVLAAAWSALVGAGSALRRATGRLLEAAVRPVTDPALSVDLALDLATFTGLGVLATIAWWHVQPAVVELGRGTRTDGADRAEGTERPDGEIVVLDDHRDRSRSTRRAA